jgi:hypothetical protein
MWKYVSSCVVAAALVFSATAAEAQQAPKQYVAINPIGAVFTIYSGEFERQVADHASFGVSVSHWGASDSEDDWGSVGVSYWSFDGKLRYYPGPQVLRGFSLGGGLGFTTMSGELVTDDGEATGRGNALSAGLFLDYSWLLGQNSNFLVGTGIGAKRLFLLGIDDSGLVLAYPTFRLSIGYAF